MNLSFRGGSRAVLTLGAAAVLGCAMLSGALPGVAAASPSGTSGGWHSARVLLVGTYKGKTGKYKSIQAAVNAARPGDWILVGPGDYHETADETGPHGNPAVGAMGGVYITKSGLTVRGMNRSSVIVDGTARGRQAVQRGAEGAELRRGGQEGHARRPQRDPGLEGQRRQRREPDRLQLPGRHRGVRQRGLVERGRRVGEDRPARLLVQLPDRHLDVLQQGDDGRRVRGLLQQLGRPGEVESALRQQHERLGHLRRRLPPSLQCRPGPPVDGEQRARLLRHELRRDHRHRELAVRPQPGRPGHQQRGRRRPAGAAGRQVPRRPAQPDHPHHLVLGGHAQRHP